MARTNAGLANQIDSFLRGYDSPMAGQGATYVAAGKKYGVDPRLGVAISGAESSFGKHLFEPFNAWGWGVHDRDAPFGSWEQSISTVMRGLARGYISQGLTTPAQIVSKYAPGSVDGNNESHWSNTVSTFMREMGAAPSTTTSKVVVRPAPTPTPTLSAPSTSTTSPLQLQLPKPMQFTPSNFGVQNALIGNLQRIATRGHASGSEMLADVMSGILSDRQSDEANKAQVDAYNKSLIELSQQLAKQQPAPTKPATQPTTVKPPNSDNEVPAPPTTQPPAVSATPEGTPATKAGASIIRVARESLGTPYLYGGATPGHFDCSGLIMYGLAQVGISVPHGSVAQYQLGQAVPKNQLRPGDAVFFHMGHWDAGYGPGHVGVYIGNGQFIQAPHTGDVVKISNLNEGWYADNYVGARRYG